MDRAPIDWPALLTRAGEPADRASLEELRRLDALRSPPADARPRPDPAPPFPWLGLLLAIAVLQTAFGLAAAAPFAGDFPLRWPQLLLAAAFSAASVLLGAAAPRDRRILFLLATFAFGASAFARAVVVAGPAARPLTPDPIVRGLFPEAFIPAALWHFAVLFPHVRRFTSFDVFARRASAAAWALGACLFVVNLGLAYGVLDGTALARLERDHPGNLFWHLFVLAALPAAATILLRARRAPPGERRKVVRFAWAIAAGMAPLLVSGVTRMSFPAVNDWMLAADPLERLWLDAGIIGALASMPVLTTLAVIVDRPFDPQIVVPPPFRRWMESALGGAVGARRFHRLRRHGHGERLAGALERVRLARGCRELAGVLRTELLLGVGAGDVTVTPAAALPSDSPLGAMLAEASSALDLSKEGPLLGLMPRRDREWLEANHVTLAAPLKLRDGEIAAVVALGARQGTGHYDADDRWFVWTLLTAASAAWDSATLPDVMASARDEVALECSRCGALSDLDPPPCGCRARVRLAALPLQLSGRFAVLRRLGSGGMGVVYLGRDLALGREVALKTLPELRHGTVPRLRDEARAMASLSHESLATIYGLEIWRRTPILVVEYFPGGTLADRLAHAPLSRAETVVLGIRLAGALSYMHARGAFHRDIKPGNIGLTATGVPKLLDFGLSPDDEPFAGTPAYLPPEALEGKVAGVAVDLWGLSAVMLEACGGRARAAGGLDRFFERALAPDATMRFQSADQMRDALDSISADGDR